MKFCKSNVRNLITNRETHFDDPFFIPKIYDIMPVQIEVMKNPDREKGKLMIEDIKDKINLTYLLYGEYTINDTDNTNILRVKVGFQIIDILN